MTIDVDEVAVRSLLEAVFKHYGYDFRQYSLAHLKRRLQHHMRMAGYVDLQEMQHAVLVDKESVATLIQDLSITVTEMFRDPDFHRAVREQVVPLLRTWSHIRIWHAGCSTGEEAYSMAIIMKEEGLQDRVQVYATDLNPRALAIASDGIYPIEAMRECSRGYQRAGGTGSILDHCITRYGSMIMDPSLKNNIVWANHNLVTDSDFAEMHLVVCRNVLIYFERGLQQHVHQLFHRSLVNGGVLCLGAKETIDHSGYQGHYDVLDKRYRIYRKKYPTP